MQNPVQGSSAGTHPPAAVQQQSATPPQQQQSAPFQSQSQSQSQQQQLTQAQLTYAQKVKGQNQGRGPVAMMNGGGQTLPRQSFMPSASTSAQSTGAGRSNGGHNAVPSGSPSKPSQSGTAPTAKPATAPSQSAQSGLSAGGHGHGHGQSQQQQQQQGQGQRLSSSSSTQQQQFRMVPTGPILQTSALQNYAYPYNYSNMQQMNRNMLHHYPQGTGTRTHSGNRQQTAYSRQQYARSAAAGSYGAAAGAGNGGSGGSSGGQRDFFDRRVQSNLNHAVNRYYNYPPSNRNYMSTSFGKTQSSNRWATSTSIQNVNRYSAAMNASYGRRRGTSSHRGGAPAGYGHGGGGGRRGGGRGGYPAQRGPPSYSASGPPRDGGYMKNGNGAPHRVSGNGPDRRERVKAQRGKPTDSQLKNYENAADRDVLCWIYENQGKCRYGQKCQWLHLDRETGQYIPTVYMTNSLDICPPVRDTKGDRNKGDKEESAKKKDGDGGGDGDEDGKEEDDDDDEDDEDKEALKVKFQAMMEKNIRSKKEEEEKRKKVDQNEEDNKEDSKTERQCVVINGERKKNSGGKGGDESKEEESGGKLKDGQYGSYGTTFDRFNVCWEFNTFVGCRKGAKCKWAHAYLVKDSAHPYTGEKLNGMAVRKFRLSNNI